MSNSNPSRDGCAVITDGYTRPAYLAGVPFTTPAVRFSYRPPLVTTRTKILREMGKASADLTPVLQAKAIETYVKEWDVKGPDGNIVLLTQEQLMRVDPIIFEGVSQIVLGLRNTGIDPEWTKEESESESAQNIDDIFGESTDAKN